MKRIAIAAVVIVLLGGAGLAVLARRVLTRDNALLEAHRARRSPDRRCPHHAALAGTRRSGADGAQIRRVALRADDTAIDMTGTLTSLSPLKGQIDARPGRWSSIG